MEKYFILFNPFSNNGRGELEAKKVLSYLTDSECEFVKMTEVPDYSEFFKLLNKEDKLIICGGDGTMNHFINDCKGVFPENDIFLFPAGSGNDFLKDINVKAPCGPVKINQYLENLPKAEVNGQTYFFINNTGFGIDGLVCADAEKEKIKNKNAQISYTPFALKAILFKYVPCNAKICVDGKEYNYERIWMAPTMNGRYFGGGMMVTPMQERLNPDGILTLMLFQGANRFQMACAFPSVFSGKHVKNPHVIFLYGHDITVEFDRPSYVEIDGEPIEDVIKYHAYRK